MRGSQGRMNASSKRFSHALNVEKMFDPPDFFFSLRGALHALIVNENCIEMDNAMVKCLSPNSWKFLRAAFQQCLTMVRLEEWEWSSSNLKWRIISRACIAKLPYFLVLCLTRSPVSTPQDLCIFPFILYQYLYSSGSNEQFCSRHQDKQIDIEHAGVVSSSSKASKFGPTHTILVLSFETWHSLLVLNNQRSTLIDVWHTPTMFCCFWQDGWQSGSVPKNKALPFIMAFIFFSMIWSTELIQWQTSCIKSTVVPVKKRLEPIN